MFNNFNNFQRYQANNQPSMNYNNTPAQSSIYTNSYINPTQNVTWIPVNGIEGAKNHIVQPGQTVWLMDNNEPKFYVKSADNFGVTSLNAYSFTKIENNNVSQNNDMSDFIRRSEIDQIIEEKINKLAELSLKGGMRES